MSKFIDDSFRAEARSRSGRCYTGARLATATHLLDIPAEFAALVRAVHQNDFDIVEMQSIAPQGSSVSPLVLKVLADHTARTGVPIQYILRDASGSTLFKTDDARSAIPFYHSPGIILKGLAGRARSDAKISAASYDTSSLKEKLRECAILGMDRNFLTKDRASGYGAAVRIGTGDIYFGGQYSAFDQRIGVHAEMAVLSDALLDGATVITHIGIASSKFPDSIAPPCGSCRQFIAEIASATGSAPVIHLFASQGEQSAAYSLDELLPVQWSSKK